MKSSCLYIGLLGLVLLVKPSFAQHPIILINGRIGAVRQASTIPAAKPVLHAAVYGYGQFEPSILISAEKVASKIFKESHIEVDWLNCASPQVCSQSFEGIQFRIAIHSQISDIMKEPEDAKLLNESDSLGFAIPCTLTDIVCLAYVFYSPINRVAATEGVNVAVILGHVIAHEVGHHLLGSIHHARTGIMQGRLPIADLNRFLYFTSTESKDLVANLSKRNRLHSN